MTWFASVGQVRIQTYLSRNRHLWGRRGASLILQQLTDPDQLNALISPHGCRLNPHAMDVDGVVDLYGPTSDQTLAAARAVAYHCRAKLPGIISSIRLGEGQSSQADLPNDYASFLGQQEEQLESFLVTPPAAEYPPLALCEECGIDPAVDCCTTGPNTKTVRLCSDCLKRLPAIDRRRWASVVRDVRPETLFDIEVQLLRELNEAEDPDEWGMHGPKYFEDLAGQGGPAVEAGGRVRDNHLALINADGNGFGALFQNLRQYVATRVDTPDLEVWLNEMQTVSRDVHHATKQALIEATQAVLAQQRDDGAATEVSPVIPHILGGDDLLVSVPARSVWPFIRTFLATANRGFDQARNSLAEFSDKHQAGNQLILPSLSMSAGVIICGYAFPFGDQVTLSEGALRQAKGQVQGAASSFAWHDVTWEGPSIENHARTWLMQPVRPEQTTDRPNLQEGTVLVEATKVMPQSGRQVLWRVLNQSDRQAARHGLDRLAFRQDEVKAVRQAVPPEWDEIDVIKDALSLARWWR